MNDDMDKFSEEETARRRDAVLKILVNTPPQPYATRQRQTKSRMTIASDRSGRKTSGRRQTHE